MPQKVNFRIPCFNLLSMEINGDGGSSTVHLLFQEPRRSLTSLGMREACVGSQLLVVSTRTLPSVVVGDWASAAPPEPSSHCSALTRVIYIVHHI